MRKIFLSALLVLFFSAAANAGKVPDGFGGIKWGTPIEEVSELLSNGSESTRRLTNYYRPDQKIVWGKIPLEEVSYDFFDDKFAGISFEVPPKHKKKILKELTSLFGKPKKKPDDVFFWDFSEDEDSPLVVEAKTVEMFGGRKVLFHVTYQIPELYHYMNDPKMWLNDMDMENR